MTDQVKYCIAVPRMSSAALIKAVEVFTREFGGCTAQQADGFWSTPEMTKEAKEAAGPDAQLDPNFIAAMWDPMNVVWSIGPAGRDVVLHTLGEEVRRIAKQQSVMVWTEPVASVTFITGPKPTHIPESKTVN